MRIGFDAKRAYHNTTGLGHYSRTLIRSLVQYYPQHRYLLFTPRRSGRFHFSDLSQVEEVLPAGFPASLLPGWWRSSGMTRDLRKREVGLYHGLSHELPLGIGRTGIPSVVTMHDLIFELYPQQYKPADRLIYRRKFQYACRQATRIIAISKQTGADLVRLYGVDPAKIDVCYQGCNPAFSVPVAPEEKLRVKQLYGLPDRFFLYVGSIIERKNLLNLCRALPLLPPEAALPLVIIGGGGGYKQRGLDYRRRARLEQRCIFLSDSPAARQHPGFLTAADFPAIYQQAAALVYPSFYEGFGIPVLEGLSSGIPVITSHQSCLPEAGGEGAFYADPSDPASIAAQLHHVLADPETVARHHILTQQHLQRFTPQATTEAVMAAYHKTLQEAGC